MENEVFTQFCTMLDEAVSNEKEIMIAMGTGRNSLATGFVPYECDYQEGIYIESMNDNSVKIENVDSITYDDIEDTYEIKSGSTLFCFSFGI